MKSIFASKTFWTNLFGAALMAGQAYTGTAVLGDPATQAAGLAIVNIILRLVTKDAVSLTGE